MAGDSTQFGRLPTKLIVGGGLIGLSKTGYAVYAQLAARLNADWKCFPAVPTIAAGAGIAQSSVYRGIAELERRGLLRVARGGGRGRVNTYLLSIQRLPPPDTVSTGSLTENLPPPDTVSTGSLTESLPPPDTVSQSKTLPTRAGNPPNPAPESLPLPDTPTECQNRDDATEKRAVAASDVESGECGSPFRERVERLGAEGFSEIEAIALTRRRGITQVDIAFANLTWQTEHGGVKDRRGYLASCITQGWERKGGSGASQANAAIERSRELRIEADAQRKAARVALDKKLNEESATLYAFIDALPAGEFHKIATKVLITKPHLRPPEGREWRRHKPLCRAVRLAVRGGSGCEATAHAGVA